MKEVLFCKKGNRKEVKEYDWNEARVYKDIADSRTIL